MAASWTEHAITVVFAQFFFATVFHVAYVMPTDVWGIQKIV